MSMAFSLLQANRAKSWNKSDTRCLEFCYAQNVFIRIVKPRNTRATRRCPNTERVVLVESRIAQKLNARRREPLDDALDGFNVPPQYCKSRWRMLAHTCD